MILSASSALKRRRVGVQDLKVLLDPRIVSDYVLEADIHIHSERQVYNLWASSQCLDQYRQALSRTRADFGFFCPTTMLRQCRSESFGTLFSIRSPHQACAKIPKRSGIYDLRNLWSWALADPWFPVLILSRDAEGLGYYPDKMAEGPYESWILGRKIAAGSRGPWKKIQCGSFRA